MKHLVDHGEKIVDAQNEHNPHRLIRVANGRYLVRDAERGHSIVAPLSKGTPFTHLLHLCRYAQAGENNRGEFSITCGSYQHNNKIFVNTRAAAEHALQHHKDGAPAPQHKAQLPPGSRASTQTALSTKRALSQSAEIPGRHRRQASPMHGVPRQGPPTAVSAGGPGSLRSISTSSRGHLNKSPSPARPAVPGGGPNISPPPAPARTLRSSSTTRPSRLGSASTHASNVAPGVQRSNTPPKSSSTEPSIRSKSRDGGGAGAKAPDDGRGRKRDRQQPALTRVRRILDAPPAATTRATDVEVAEKLLRLSGRSLSQSSLLSNPPSRRQLSPRDVSPTPGSRMLPSGSSSPGRPSTQSRAPAQEGSTSRLRGSLR